MSKRKWWFRESTKEWVWEWTVDNTNLHGTYRYSSKTKLGCIVNFLLYCRGMFKDIKQTK